MRYHWWHAFKDLSTALKMNLYVCILHVSFKMQWIIVKTGIHHCCIEQHLLKIVSTAININFLSHKYFKERNQNCPMADYMFSVLILSNWNVEISWKFRTIDLCLIFSSNILPNRFEVAWPLAFRQNNLVLHLWKMVECQNTFNLNLVSCNLCFFSK